MSRKIILLIFVILFSFTACSTVNKQDVTSQTPSTTEVTEGTDLFKGAWISYFELKSNDRSENEYTSYLRGLFENMKKVSVTDAFIHVRAFGDAAYQSELFPPAEFICGENGELPFDVLDLALKIGKEYGINIHAWLNPYRAQPVENASKMTDCKMKAWLEAGSDNILSVSGRNYFNPASDEVRLLIIDGVREILKNYPDIKGIHIDDYFYPENCGDFDKKSYEAYVKNAGKLSLGDWRRENVNSLVSGIYAAVKSFGSEKIFSVSPCGDIEKNYGTLYADVSLWCSQKGYCDMIIPQVYFGFNNKNLPFCDTVDRWEALTMGSETELVIGLALYKCGQEDKYAGESGINEWKENSDIIKRQVEYIKSKNLKGFSLYSASFINFSESFLSEEVNNLKSVL